VVVSRHSSIIATLYPEHPVQLVAVHEPQAEELVDELKSPSEADPLLKPKVEKSFFILFLPQTAHLSASSEVLRAKYSNSSPQSSHLYS
jgi:hypothetical protein